MKIALLSFHNAANYGAALQAFALQHALEQKGHSCEYINYLNHERRYHYSVSYLFWNAIKKGQVFAAAKFMVGAPFLLARKSKFKRFYKKYLHVTKGEYRNSLQAAALNPQYDRFIVGSDQVWNPFNNGNDTAFLLDFVKEPRKKISYSSSFGLSELDEDLKDRYRSCFSSFHALSVREKIGQRIVEDLIGITPELVLDPVMLLTSDMWRNMSSSVKAPHEQYIFTYTNREQQVADFFKTGYHLGDRKLYKLSRFTKPKDFINPSVRVKYWMSPLEFVSVIANAELVVSASFHCLAMSILLNRPFVAILTGDEGKDERLVNMLKLFGLEKRALSESMTATTILEPINWESVNAVIAKMRMGSMQYLINAIGGDEG